MPKLLDETRIPFDLSDQTTSAIRWRWFLDRLWWVWWRILWWLECWLKLWRRLAFTMQAQLQSQWCWAACSVSVSLFYDSASGWTQCSVVNAELGQSTCCQNGSTSQCNQPWYLNLALTRTGNLASWSGGTAPIAQICSEIRNGRPVGARIGWSGGGGHFVMMAGYRSCDPDEYIDVRDPIYGSSDIALATFTSSYQAPAPGPTRTTRSPSAVPIVTSQLPPDAIDAVRRTLSATERFPRRRGGALSLSSPHPVFTVALERLAAGDRPLDAAELVGWRALLEENKRVVAAVELPGAEPGKAGALVNRGPFVQSTVAALTKAERHGRVASERVALRLLRVNALYLLALWLHAAETEADLFVPLAPAPAPLRAETAYEGTEFESELSGMAQSVVSLYQAAERPDELGS